MSVASVDSDQVPLLFCQVAAGETLLMRLLLVNHQTAEAAALRLSEGLKRSLFCCLSLSLASPQHVKTH